MNIPLVPGFFATDGDEDALRAAGLPLAVVSLPGLVEGIDDVDEALARLASAVDGHRVVLGYSMGARLLLQALARGARVDHAVLLSLSRTPVDEDARAARRALDEERARALELDPAGFTDAWGALPVFADARAHAAWIAQQGRRRAIDGALARRHARTLRWFSAGALPVVDVAAFDTALTLVVGARDVDARAVAADLAARARRAALLVVPGAGHVLPLEAPAAVARVVVDACSTHPTHEETAA